MWIGTKLELFVKYSDSIDKLKTWNEQHRKLRVHDLC